MFEETNSEKLFTPLESPQKNDVKRPTRDSEERMTITIKDLTK